MAPRHLLLGAALLALGGSGIGFAQEAQVPPEQPAKKPVFIFLQSAKSVSYDKGKLTLNGVSGTTIYFADRPERVTGHMSTRAFIPFWREGKETFLADPPHATLSVLGQRDGSDVVVELRDPVLKGDELSYGATILQGEIPAKGGVASLFIDLVGLPATAIINAGAEQRMWRRRGYY